MIDSVDIAAPALHFDQHAGVQASSAQLEQCCQVNEQWFQVNEAGVIK